MFCCGWNVIQNVLLTLKPTVYCFCLIICVIFAHPTNESIMYGPELGLSNRISVIYSYKKEIFKNRRKIWFNLIKSLVKDFRVRRNKEALKMKYNKRNRNIRYPMFRDSNSNRVLNVLLNRTGSFFCTFVIDLARFNWKGFFCFWIYFFFFFFIFCRFVKTKCRTFSRMALKWSNRPQITSTWRI